jgi:hypothetical protein
MVRCGGCELKVKRMRARGEVRSERRRGEENL